MRVLTALLLIASPTLGAPPAAPKLPYEDLAILLRNLLLANLPDPLIQKSFNWGKMREVPNGITWKRDGILLRPQVQRKLKNDGVWRKVKVTADDPATLLRFGITDMQAPEEGRMTFAVNIIQPVHVLFEQQVWESGVRLYGGSTRARCRVGIRLSVEFTSRLERNEKSFVPDVVFRARVTDARLGYDDLVVEHTLGVDGEMARRLGAALLDTVKDWKPSLERELLVKANAAIVKAGDTKEVRVSLAKLLQGQKAIEKKKQ